MRRSTMSQFSTTVTSTIVDQSCRFNQWYMPTALIEDTILNLVVMCACPVGKHFYLECTRVLVVWLQTKSKLVCTQLSSQSYFLSKHCMVVFTSFLKWATLSWTSDTVSYTVALSVPRFLPSKQSSSYSIIPASICGQKFDFVSALLLPGIEKSF